MAVILFYKGKTTANGKKNYDFDNIINFWSDYKLEKEHDFIQWLFPDETGGVNENGPHLTENDVDKFRSSNKLRKNVIKAVLRMMLFYGFAVNKNFKVKQIKPLKRIENGIIVGLYSTHNYKRLTRMMIFLNRINMEMLSALVFLSLCKAGNADTTLREKMIKSGAIKIWKQTQSYIQIQKLEKVYSPRKNDEDEDADEDDNKKCTFTGLNYNSNSCYQDSVLMSLFAIPNDFIQKSILTKDVKSLTEKNSKKWIVCSENQQKDYEIRQEIKKELNDIAKNIQQGNHSVAITCKNLRKIFSRCSTIEKFHETNTQDAGEFLQYIFNIFKVISSVRTRSIYVTNDIKSHDNFHKVSEITEFESPIFLLPSSILSKYQEISITNLLEQVEDAIFSDENLYRDRATGMQYRRRIELYRLVDAEYAVFYAQRVYFDISRGKTLRNVTSILPPEKIQLSSKTLKLTSIVTHVSNHYTCYICCDEKWFYYNDNPGSNKFMVKKIGSYKKMLEETPNPMKYGVLYFYT